MKFSVSMTAQKKRLFFYSKRPKMGQFRRVKQNQQMSNSIKLKFDTIKFDNFPKISNQQLSSSKDTNPL